MNISFTQQVIIMSNIQYFSSKDKAKKLLTLRSQAYDVKEVRIVLRFWKYLL